MGTKLAARTIALTGGLALALSLTGSRAWAQDGAAPVPPPPDSSVVPAAPVEQPATPPANVIPAPPVAPIVAGADTTGLALPILAEVRARDVIAADRIAVAEQRRIASERMVRAREAEIRWRSRADIKKTEIDALKKRIALYKKEKREADVEALDPQRKNDEAKRDYFDRVEGMYGVEADFQKSAIDYLDARTRNLDAEAQLAERWAAPVGAQRTGENLQAELRALDVARERAGKMSVMADKERAWADRRKAVYDAWRRIAF